MHTPLPFRPALAALLVLSGLAGAYHTAVRWPGQPVAAAPALGPGSPVLADTLAAAAADTLTPPPAPASRPLDPVPTQEGPTYSGPRDPRPVFERAGPASRTLRRYVGTVGGQPATALLDWQHPDGPQGRFYLHRGGPEHSLDQPSDLPRNVLRVDGTSGEWHLRGRPGATLSGTWRGGPSGRPLAVGLREDYRGAVRLGIQAWRVRGRYTITTTDGLVYSSVPEVQREFMHLANPASVPTALRPVLSPSPARRRWLLLDEGAIDCTISQGLDVRLNDFGLLSYQYSVMTSAIGGYSDIANRNALLDLQTGRWLALQSQLRPGYEPGLSSLLARHLLDDNVLRGRTSEWRQQLGTPLPQERDTLRAATRWVQQELAGQGNPVFTGAGMELEYPLNSFVEATPLEDFTVLIPYAELRPLVRPGTPLARLLRARGL